MLAIHKSTPLFLPALKTEPCFFPGSVRYTPDRRHFSLGYFYFRLAAAPRAAVRYVPIRIRVHRFGAAKYRWFARYLSSTPRAQAEALGSRQAAARRAASRVFTPTVVLTEPPPLLVAVAGREYHYPSDDYGHAGSGPAFAEGVLARPDILSGVLAYPAAAAWAFFAHRN